MKLLEELAIRFLWIVDALRPKAIRPWTCPPKCSLGHTYKWPCRNRIKAPNEKATARYAYYDTRDEVNLNEYPEPEEIAICGITRAIGYGDSKPAICILPKDHETGHVWTTQ